MPTLRSLPVLLAGVAALALGGCETTSLPTARAVQTAKTVPVAGTLEVSEPAQPRLSHPRHAGEDTPDKSMLLARRERLEREGPKSFDKPAEAQRFFLGQRLAPGMTDYPIDLLHDALAGVRARQAVESPGSPGDLDAWQAIGPGNIGGRTRAIAIDPTNPDVMFAGGVAGGVWKSTNAGASWTATDDFLVNLAVTTIVIDPTNTDVIYAGTGEGYLAVSSFVRGLGIFKSTDGGASWTQLPQTTGPEFHYVNKLVLSPNDPNRIYAATRSGVWRSLDAGATWSVVLRNPRELDGDAPASLGCQAGALDLAVRADRNPDVLFATFGSFESDGLYRSDNGGSSWIRYGVPSNQGRMTFAIAPSDNDIMYLGMADNGTGGQLGQLVSIFRSLDGGATWESRVDFSTLTGPWLFSNLALATGCLSSFQTYSQGWYDQAIAVDPVNPDVLWVGGIDIFRSDDGGRTFGIAGYWFANQTSFVPNSNYIHADIHTIVFHPDYDGVTNRTMLVGNDGGIFRTTDATAATSVEDCPFPANDPLPAIAWENLNNGYAVTQYYHGDAAATADRFVGGAQDNGTSLVDSRTTPNQWQSIFGGDGGYVAIDPTDPDTIYVEIQFFPEIRKSTDGGQTFSLAVNGITDTNGVFIVPFAMDQQTPDILWTGSTRPWRTTNGAALWTPAGPDLVGPDRVSAIAISPADSNVVYLGYSNGYVARSLNALDPNPTWAIVSSGLRSGAWVSSVAIDPTDPDTAYATYSNYGGQHIYKTTNGGLLWQSIDGIGFAGVPDIPVHWLAIRPCKPDQLFAATELGVFASDDAGASWSPANTGLANTVVESLDFHDEDTLVAFTHGRGVFVADLAPCNACFADLTGSSDPNDPSYGQPDGDADGDDFFFYLDAFSSNNLAVCDLTGSSDPNDPTYATPDGDCDGDDFFFYLNRFQEGCP